MANAAQDQMIFSKVQRVLLHALYAKTPCGICLVRAWCDHREPDADWAALEARKEARDAGKP